MAGVALLFIGDGNQRKHNIIRYLSLSASILTLVLGIWLYFEFDNTTHSMQFIEQATWIASLNIEYYLGVDGISVPLILLTVFIAWLNERGQAMQRCR